jgi:hypothetical protein
MFYKNYIYIYKKYSISPHHASFSNTLAACAQKARDVDIELVWLVRPNLMVMAHCMMDLLQLLWVFSSKS